MRREIIITEKSHLQYSNEIKGKFQFQDFSTSRFEWRGSCRGCRRRRWGRRRRRNRGRERFEEAEEIREKGKRRRRRGRKRKRKRKRNSRKSVTWSAVPDAPMLVYFVIR